MATVSNGVKELEYGKIFLSNVVIVGKRNLFWGRKWTTTDVHMVVGVLAMHILTLFAPFTFTWGAFWAAVVGYILSGLFGVTLTYHRILAHRSLKYQERNNVDDLKSQVFYRFIRRTYVWHEIVLAALVCNTLKSEYAAEC
ncbi:palmitoyl-monogalactosyldiacylglycerol delta-7 desaturase, chloroplastic-like protein [Tanacetum coccineum]